MRDSKERIVQLIEDLDAIEFYDRVMFNARICNREVIHNMDVQDKLLYRLEKLDYDAYLCYLCDDRETINKYYSRKVVEDGILHEI